MKDLRRRFDRFCFVNRNKGIPNLMMYVSIGCVIVYFLTMIDPSQKIYSYLYFNPVLIRQGQIWRFFTYPLCYFGSNPLSTAISLLCSYYIGRTVESIWGTLKFNLFYFSGIILIGAYCVATNCLLSAYYLNTTLLLCYATLLPNAQFLLMYIIPIKAWVFALISIAMLVYYMINPFPYSLIPVVALVNYLLFVGKDVVNILPESLRYKIGRGPKKASHKTIQFKPSESRQTQHKAPSYTHKCTVCGRTDVSNPELEFRYCSRCKGYYCYCQKHISSHAHIQ